MSSCVTIGQIQYVHMALSGGDGCFVFTVHSRWIQVALATSCRCGSSRQDWWRTHIIRVRIVEARPHLIKGTPPPPPKWVFRNGHPVGSQGRHRCRVGSFPESRPALGGGGGGGGSRNPATDGGVDFGRDRGARYVCAFFSRARPEVRGRARKWVSSPGENCMCAEDGCSPDGWY